MIVRRKNGKLIIMARHVNGHAEPLPQPDPLDRLTAGPTTFRPSAWSRWSAPPLPPRSPPPLPRVTCTLPILIFLFVFPWQFGIRCDDAIFQLWYHWRYVQKKKKKNHFQSVRDTEISSSRRLYTWTPRAHPPLRGMLGLRGGKEGYWEEF